MCAQIARRCPDCIGAPSIRRERGRIMESTEDAIEIEDAEERGATAPHGPCGELRPDPPAVRRVCRAAAHPACGALHRWVGGRVHAARHDQHVHYHRRAADLRQLHDRRRALGRLLRLVRAARAAARQTRRPVRPASGVDPGHHHLGYRLAGLHRSGDRARRRVDPLLHRAVPRVYAALGAP